MLQKKFAFMKADKIDQKRKRYGSKGDKVKIINSNYNGLVAVEHAVTGEKFFINENLLSDTPVK